MLTIAQAAEHFRRAAAETEGELMALVAKSAYRGAALAKSYIGHQQDSWEPLSTATIQGFRHESGFWIKGKAELGFRPPDYEPLLRSGEMRESIRASAHGLTGVIGSTSQTALYQEMGTHGRYRIPPRPFLALALKAILPVIMADGGKLAVQLLTPRT